jgi:hypothetical protein
MRGAPEEPVAAALPRLGFLHDPPLQESIATDIASAESALADGRYKNACIMSGAAIEALLLWAVQRRTPPIFRRLSAGFKPGVLKRDAPPSRRSIRIRENGASSSTLKSLETYQSFLEFLQPHVCWPRISVT